MTKFVCISDTHSRQDHFDINKLPLGDVLIHAGDATMVGRPDELIALNNWFKAIKGVKKYDSIVYVPGNHDWRFETHELDARTIVDEATVLIQQSIVIDGIKIYGFPHTPWFHDWAFNVRRDTPEMKAIMNRIPADTEILITHGPAKDILDGVPHLVSVMGKNGQAKFEHFTEHVGCEQLLATVMNKLPALNTHVVGHIHESAGVQFTQANTGNRFRTINASQLNDRYVWVNEPICFEINK